MKKKDIKYYRLDDILKFKATYYVVYGERSNGKTYAVLEHAIEKYFNGGGALGLIRRYEEDLKGRKGLDVFKAFIVNGAIKRMSKGRYNSIKYISRSWFFQRINAESEVEEIDKEPFAFAFVLSQEEHYKSLSYPTITTILFDEFITRNIYFDNEFLMFTSILSTIIRDRDNIEVFMCGNTINQYCPYFAEMGLSNIKKQKQGTIDLYTYANTELSVAVEYCDKLENKREKKSNKYFAFNNPKLNMITGGSWEIALYPHLPRKYTPKNIITKYYILFDNELLQADIVSLGIFNFTYIHRKTTNINYDDAFKQGYYIFQQDINDYPNVKRKITSVNNSYMQKIVSFFKNDKVFYQDNEVGEIVRNYLNWCITSK